MKPNPIFCWITLVSYLAIGCVPARSQGTLVFETNQVDPRWRASFYFANRALSIDAPVFHLDCVTPLAGDEFVAALYAGPEGALASELALAWPPTPFRTGQFSGYWVPQTPEGFVIGQRIAAQVRVWEAQAGSFEAAQSGAGLYGVSQVLTLHFTSSPTGPGDYMEGLQSFCLVPEPSPFWLWAGGGIVVGLLTMRRRRQRETSSGIMRPKCVAECQSKLLITMKHKLLFYLFAVTGGIASFPVCAQGSFIFSNRVLPMIDAPMFHTDCVTPLAGDEFVAALYAGPQGSVESELVQVLPPTPFRTGQFAGYWVAQGAQFTIGETIAAQARVWEAKAVSFEAAQAGAGLYGSSKVLEILITSTATSLPDALHGLESFCLVPEPAPVWLWAGGGIVLGFLALRRRRQGEAASETMRPK